MNYWEHCVIGPSQAQFIAYDDRMRPRNAKLANDVIVSDPEQGMRRTRQSIRQIISSGTAPKSEGRPKDRIAEAIQSLKRQRGK
jgi:hypothetical protein